MGSIWLEPSSRQKNAPSCFPKTTRRASSTAKRVASTARLKGKTTKCQRLPSGTHSDMLLASPSLEKSWCLSQCRPTTTTTSSNLRQSISELESSSRSTKSTCSFWVSGPSSLQEYSQSRKHLSSLMSNLWFRPISPPSKTSRQFLNLLAPTPLSTQP